MKAKFNVKLLRKVQKRILSEPKSFSMESWKERTDCGTEMCIGGWTCALSNKRGSVPDEVEYRASKLLGISLDEADVLFFDQRWPEKIANKYQAAENAHNHPRMALWASKMIDWFIAQKKAGKEVAAYSVD